MIKLNALVLAAFAVLNSASASAFASTPTSTLTRAQVVAEFERARAAGELPASANETNTKTQRPAASTLTRAEVQAEYLRARAAGEPIDIEEQASAANSTANSARTAAPTGARAMALTRAEVLSDYLRARHSGELALRSNDAGEPQYRRAMQ